MLSALDLITQEALALCCLWHSAGIMSLSYISVIMSLVYISIIIRDDLKEPGTPIPYPS